jgi:hypothetical protein
MFSGLVHPSPSRLRLALAFSMFAAAPAAAQQYTGPSKCTSCHDHDRQAAKWQKEEPAQFKDKAHFNTRKQLDGPKAAAYAKAAGLADSYDLKGSCVACHSTVFRGDANAGVSCESCHGPASGYLEPHQQKGAYAKSVSLGLRDLKNKPPVIAKACVTCHLTTDRKLVAAGHPSGADFDVGGGLKKVVHWNTAYDFAAVTAAGKAAMGSGAARAAAAPAPPAAAKGAAPAAAPPAAAAKGTTGAGAAAAPPAAAAPAAAAPAAPRPAAAAPAAGAAAAPWDWDQPIRALPADYVPEAAAPEAAPEPPPAAASGAAAPAPAAAARPRAPRRVAPAPSLAEDLPVTPALVATEAAALDAPPPAAAPAGPKSATARVAEARGGAALVLARVLRDGKKAPDLPPASAPKEFKGPDGELLRLQDEAIALALEALRRP